MSLRGHLAFRQQLVEAGLLVPAGADGLYGRSAGFEAAVRGIERLVHAAGTRAAGTGAAGTGSGARTPPAEVHFPPVMARSTLETTGYLGSFPDLVGVVEVFKGDDRRHAALLARIKEGGTGWTEELEASELALCPAACHPLYPACSGRLPEGGSRYEVSGYCFRHEPSLDPARMQAFRMREQVYLGDPAAALQHRDGWLDLGLGLLSNIGIEARAEPANDPFFGRVGQLLAAGQRDQHLKVELVAPTATGEASTALVSGNYHLDHFGEPFGILTRSGETAHSSCVGFGLDRIVLALCHVHGTDLAGWPSEIREKLMLDAA
ncbi:MAG: amino acid--[acyl-carrier-protein] ligase [Acidimicrobiales bacterium]